MVGKFDMRNAHQQTVGFCVKGVVARVCGLRRGGGLEWVLYCFYYILIVFFY